MSLRCPTVALLYLTLNESPFCDVAQTSDCGISFKSPLCGVAQTPDCGISFKALYVASLRRPTVAFLLKPFMWRRSDAQLWHFF